MKTKRKPRGAQVEWMKCDCPSPVAFGLFMRCPACSFLFRDDLPPRTPSQQAAPSKVFRGVP
jgi:hypothetical protein